MVNKSKGFCYRITHISNLPLLLRNGIVNKNHSNSDSAYIQIGNPEIIDVRSVTPVRIKDYGLIGEYVPFYFTPRSIMLYNIVTGYYEPKVPKRNRGEVLVIRCLIKKLMELPQWFFTDGQANILDGSVHHYNDEAFLEKIDWENIQRSNFSKTDGDYDRPKRYQAEFLVYQEVPFGLVESLNVCNQETADKVINILNENGINLAVNVQPQYFF